MVDNHLRESQALLQAARVEGIGEYLTTVGLELLKSFAGCIKVDLGEFFDRHRAANSLDRIPEVEHAEQHAVKHLVGHTQSIIHDDVVDQVERLPVVLSPDITELDLP